MFKLRIDHKQILTKPMLVMLLGVAALFGSLFAWKAIHSYLVVRQGRLMLQPEIPVSTTKVTLSSWQPVLKAVGTLRAVLGITVTTETPGLVEKIYFLPGAYVKKGERLLQLNADTERSQFQAMEAEIINPRASLIPGMYVSIEIQAQKPKRYLTLPQSALSFDSYGEFVFLVKTKAVKSKPPQFFVEQTYVTTGAMRENEVAILKGLKVGDLVVTGGQLKLNNGSVIKIDNAAVPALKG
jgi:multidrug efflux pump subunit AcrA (membrane-fusion protein)